MAGMGYAHASTESGYGLRTRRCGRLHTGRTLPTPPPLLQGSPSLLCEWAREGGREGRREGGRGRAVGRGAANLEDVKAGG
eukprot:2570899-Rhodomonas_salina.1